MDFSTHVQGIASGEKNTNLEVLEMAKAKQTFLRTIQERKLQYFGHLIRGKGN